MTDIRLHSTEAIRFRQVVHNLDLSERASILSWWNIQMNLQPSLFNGPLIACHNYEVVQDGISLIDWFKTDYAHYISRNNPAIMVAPARAIFCSVAVVTSAGRLLVGRMAPGTASPGRVQLPGGNISNEDWDVSLDSTARDARREFMEEVGIDVSPQDLELWRVKVGGRFDDLGLIFRLNRLISETDILQQFRARVGRLKAANCEPEFSQIAFVAATDGLDMFGPPVDYLPMVLSEILASAP